MVPLGMKQQYSVPKPPTEGEVIIKYFLLYGQSITPNIYIIESMPFTL